MTDIIYNGDFGNWSDVAMEFSGKYRGYANAEAEALAIIPEPDNVIYADYETGNYEGSALVIFKQAGLYGWVEGSHCSCYGLEGQWEPEMYAKDIFIQVLDRKIENAWDSYSGSPQYNKKLLQEIKIRIEKDE